MGATSYSIPYKSCQVPLSSISHHLPYLSVLIGIQTSFPWSVEHLCQMFIKCPQKKCLLNSFTLAFILGNTFPARQWCLHTVAAQMGLPLGCQLLCFHCCHHPHRATTHESAQRWNKALAISLLQQCLRPTGRLSFLQTDLIHVLLQQLLWLVIGDSIQLLSHKTKRIHQ